ncbi:MAG: hypothetical protein KDA77_16780 [Planctomycetaceae bacterium]|nr:hypothetical protein [Planctomycetaceae bacterium]
MKHFPKWLYQLVYASCAVLVISFRYFPGNIVTFLIIVFLLCGVIPLPSSLGDVWTILDIVLFVIAVLTALFFFIAILMIFLPPEATFDKERIQIGGNIIKLEEIIKIQIAETAIAHCIDIHYRYSDDKTDTKETIYLVINDSTKNKLDKMKVWCRRKQIGVEVA